jgi:hypothetical protein
MRDQAFGGGGGSSASVQFPADTGATSDFQMLVLRQVHASELVGGLWEMIHTVGRV